MPKLFKKYETPYPSWMERESRPFFTQLSSQRSMGNLGFKAGNTLSSDVIVLLGEFSRTNTA